MSNSSYIYHGPWINWSHGLIGGATITLGQREGGLLTAFIATFVTIVGAELWKIICYTGHQVKSRHTPQDGLYHQQQVILKNSAGPAGTAWLFVQQCYEWTGVARRSVLRTIPLAIFGVVYICLVGVVAIFSSEISKSPGPLRLLMNPDACGSWVLNATSPYRTEAFVEKSLTDSIASAAYSKACYNTDTADPLACGRFPVPSITWTSNKNATCPFQAGMCLFDDTSAFTAKSKLIDSHIDLGINARKSNRLHLEKTTTCAPLRTRGYLEVMNATDDPDGLGIPGDKIMKFYYGETTNFTNLTFSYNDHAARDSFPYTIKALTATAGHNSGNGSFVPVPAINRTDADLSLLFLAANAVTYEQACDDALFAAHYFVDGVSLGIDIAYYTADRYVNVLGCAEQFRVCNPENDKCTDNLGVMQLQAAVLDTANHMSLNSAQIATAIRLIGALQVSTVYYQTFTRLGGALRATEKLNGLSQRYLPPNQWHIEVGSWFDTGLARLQQRAQEYATGPAVYPRGSVVLKPDPDVHPDDAPWQDMCYSQLVNDSSDTMSFSVVGLAVLFGLGLLIIFWSIIMDTVVGWIQLKTGNGLHARMEWLTNDKLQLQKLLHEEMRLGVWHDGTRLPVTPKDQRFMGPADRHVTLAGNQRDGQDGAGAQLVDEKYSTRQETRYLGREMD